MTKNEIKSFTNNLIIGELKEYSEYKYYIDFEKRHPFFKEIRHKWFWDFKLWKK